MGYMRSVPQAGEPVGSRISRVITRYAHAHKHTHIHTHILRSPPARSTDSTQDFRSIELVPNHPISATLTAPNTLPEGKQQLRKEAWALAAVGGDHTT